MGAVLILTGKESEISRSENRKKDENMRHLNLKNVGEKDKW